MKTSSLIPYLSNPKYRYGFNGQEKDDEITDVTGATNTAMYWEYDTRLGRRWNTDPVKKPWQSDYACFSDNPIARVDPNGDDDYFNSDGSYSHSTKTGTAIKVTTRDGVKDFADYKVYDVHTLHTVSNIATYYAKQLGMTNAVGGKPGSDDPSRNPAFTVMSGKNFKGMFLNIKGGFVAKHLNDFNNLKSVLKHEEKHKEGVGSGEGFGHLNVYLGQMKDKTFDNTTEDFKGGMVGAYSKILQETASEELDSHGNTENAASYVNEFNKLSGKTGVKLQMTTYGLNTVDKEDDKVKIEVFKAQPKK